MDTLQLARWSLVVVCVAALGSWAWNFQAVTAGLARFFFEPQPAINLGLLRIAIFWLIWDAARGSEAPWFASLPATFRVFPAGWSWFADSLPMNFELVSRARTLLSWSSAFAVVGAATRFTTVISVVLALYVLGVENFFFKISHSMHVPMLSAMVLAASPCGDAASLDSWWRRHRGKPSFAAHAAYTVPVRFCWLLLGTMYLFPGLWKLWQSGDLWLEGIKPRVEMLDKWGQMQNFRPLFRADRMPWLLSLLGLGTLLLEIGFLPALFARSSRVIAGVGAFVFHLGIGLTMGIWFSSLHPLIVLIDYPGLLELAPVRALSVRLARLGVRLRRAPAAALLTRGPRSVGASFVVGTVLVCGMTLAGLAPIDSWPIAIYPRFSSRSSSLPKRGFALRFVVQSAAGVERRLTPRFRHFGEDSASITRIIRALSDAKKRGKAERLAAYTNLLLFILKDEGERFAPGDTLLVYRYSFPIEPDERQFARVDYDLLASVDL